MTGQEYSTVVADAERRRAICTEDTAEGRKAKAGQFWDDATQRDSRDPHSKDER